MARYMNILSLVFTDDATAGALPNGASAATTFLGVQSLNVNDGTTLGKSAGDNDIGPSEVDVVSIEPMVGAKFEDITPLAIQPFTGRRGKLVAIIGKKNTRTPGMQVTLEPCVCLVKGMTASYRKESDSDLEFHGICKNGNPLSIIVAPTT